MSNINNYLHLINHNSKLLELLTVNLPKNYANENFSDWQVTIIFYISCIYLKAVCFLNGKDVQDHQKLREIINTDQALKELWYIAKHYRHIEEASRDARYEGRKFSKEYIKERILPKFYKVRDCAVSIINSKNISNVPVIDLGFLSEEQ